jgi:hypothetical protein
MDLIPNRYDALILRLTTISPLARHVIDSEQYRLRLETDEVDSEAVLQELVLALRDDLAAIGLYLTCPLADLYEDYATFDHILDALEYLFPNTFYPKLRSDAKIRPMLLDLLSGGVGDESTIMLYLRWLGSGPDCYVPSCAIGAHWLADRLTSTPLFDTYLKDLTEVETTLDKPVEMGADDLLAYVKTIHGMAHGIYDALEQLTAIPELTADHDLLRRRFDLYIRYLLQPNHAAENAWLRMTAGSDLSEDLQVIHQRRWEEFRHSQRLYAEYYRDRPITDFTPFVVAGIAIRRYADQPSMTRAAYLAALREEFGPRLAQLSITLRSLLARIANTLYPTPAVAA